MQRGLRLCRLLIGGQQSSPLHHCEENRIPQQQKPNQCFHHAFVSCAINQRPCRTRLSTMSNGTLRRFRSTASAPPLSTTGALLSPSSTCCRSIAPQLACSAPLYNASAVFSGNDAYFPAFAACSLPGSPRPPPPLTSPPAPI